MIPNRGTTIVVNLPRFIQWNAMDRFTSIARQNAISRMDRRRRKAIWHHMPGWTQRMLHLPGGWGD